MEAKNKKILVATICLAVAIPGALWAKSLIGPSVVNCEAGGSCNISIQQAANPAGSDTLGASQTQDFTNLTALALSGDLSVGGTTTFTGAVSNSFGSNVQFYVSSTMSNGTSTPCAIQNLSGRTRSINSLNFVYVSTTSIGSFGATVGTSTNAFPTTTSTSPLISTVLTTQQQDVISTTSSVQTVYAPWRQNEWLVFRTNTTTNVGQCYVEFN
jgi:hypothetical protein